MVENEAVNENVIETSIVAVLRVYMRPVRGSVVMDMLVNVECGGTILLSGLTSYEHGSPVRVDKRQIMGYVEPKKSPQVREIVEVPSKDVKKPKSKNGKKK